ncbi:MAG: PadR family transcriptional regulator [Phycisphaerales bacterium]
MSGVPELLILQLLGRSEMYGYELVTELERVTGDRIRLGDGVVYPQLHTLERGGHLLSRREVVSGRPRVYYRLSAKGRRRLSSLRADWSHTTTAVDLVLNLPGAARVEPT